MPATAEANYSECRMNAVDLEVLHLPPFAPNMCESPLESVPDDLITQTVSFLPLKQILLIAATSSRFLKSCNTVLKQIRNVSLYLYALSDRDEESGIIGTRVSIHHSTSQVHINLLWNKWKNNVGIIKLLKTMWKNVHCFYSEHHDICTIMKHLGLPHHQIQNIHLLAHKTRSYFTKIPYLTNLHWIETQYSDKTLWNALIKHCPHLHGISFHCNTKDDTDHTDSDIPFELAPNLWALSIRFDGDTIRPMDADVIDDMLQYTPNLKYLQMTGSHSIVTHDATSNMVRVPSGLIALKANCECLRGIAYDITSCRDLRFIDLEISFFTENIQLDDLSDFHRPLSMLLASFLEINMYTAFQKVIGVALDYENGTPNVSKQEKLTAITQFKSIIEESARDVVELYRRVQCKQLEIVSTQCGECVSCRCLPDSMVDVWSHALFSIPKERIMKQYDTNAVLYGILSELGRNDESYWKVLDFFQLVVVHGLY